jgi:HK97 family phage major capsid protein
MPTIEQKIDGFLQEHKSWRGRHDATLSGMQKQLDAMDANHQRPNYSGGGGGGGDLASEIFEAPEFKAFAQTGKGRFALNISDFQQKAAILSSTVGYSTPGVVGSERVGGIFPAAMSTYRVRNLLRQVPTTAGVIDFLRATSYTKGSPQAEADEKLEATIAFEDASEKMRTLAHWVPASRQVLQDVSGLQETINVHLMAGLRDLEDEEILSGDGSGEHLHGLIHLASSFDTGLLWAGPSVNCKSPSGLLAGWS